VSGIPDCIGITLNEAQNRQDTMKRRSTHTLAVLQHIREMDLQLLSVYIFDMLMILNTFLRHWRLLNVCCDGVVFTSLAHILKILPNTPIFKCHVITFTNCC